MAGISQLKPKVELALFSEDFPENPAFDLDIARLCLAIKELGSLNAAARHVGMAYSRAWRILKNAEEALGQPLLIRDGAHGSTLTELGEELVETFDELRKSIDSYAAEQVAAKLG